MEKRILSYRRYIDELLKKEDVDWQKASAEHLVQIGFFQHERLVHLIVTVTFAILEILSLFMTLMSFEFGSGNLGLGCLTVLLLILLIPYIRHYYILENETQKMYTQYDLMRNKDSKAFPTPL